jgi:hypothetical protein
MVQENNGEWGRGWEGAGSSIGRGRGGSGRERKHRTEGEEKAKDGEAG